MATVKPQAILGVTAGSEGIVMTVWPSVASTGLGRFIGSLCESISLKINGVKLSYLLFGLPSAPVALLPYVLLKVAGERYLLTNRSVQRWSSLGSRMIAEVQLSAIDDIAIQQLPGQEFYHAADLLLMGADGSTLMRLEGVVRPEVFRQNILETCDARSQVEESLETIEARQSA